ncbi:ABC transporter substrate-binding protein [Mesorhizobium sp. M0520]|uniref:ABC transporter substrate-binding protein n=1 Tax=Mesorhizobium sp. M0520 TaxID=2956957 RepID=UPI00333B89B9
MTISRRNLLKMGIAAGTAVSIPSVLRAQTAPNPDRTVRMVLEELRVFDPVATTADITQTHALAVYDTLFGVDSKFVPQPQMVGKWGVSDDKKTYTFELREGLGWHDGTPVTAADCVASIRRWGQVAPGGQLLMGRAKDISKRDDKTFTIALKEPLGVLPSILGFPGPFVMREKDANLPPTEQATDNIGSGPLKFNHALAKPGASFTYDRNEKYVPRSEPADTYAGGKVVNIDRVILDNIADQQTALAAMQAGEVDFFLRPSGDVFPMIESDPNLELQVLNPWGQDAFVRVNCLQKPFDNVKARQALLHLLDQEAFMRVMSPDPKYGRAVTSLFGANTAYTNDENTGWFKKGGNPEKAKQLFQESGYAGEKVVILQNEGSPQFGNAGQLVGAALQKIGVNVELASSDWGGIVARRPNKGPVEEGGWSIFLSSEPLGVDIFNTVSLPMNGDKAWFGWPQNDEFEALRAQWADLETLDERKALARKMQRICWEYVPQVLLGEYVNPIVRRKTLTGLIGLPSEAVPMWNMQKA